MTDAQEAEVRRIEREEARYQTEQADKLRWQEYQVQVRKEDIARQEQREELEKKRRKNKIASDIPPLPKLRDPKELVHFMTSFKKHMIRYEVDQEQWAIILKPLLDSKTASHMDHLSQEEVDDFDDLAKSLAHFNGINSAYHRRQWENVTWKDKSIPLESFLNLQNINQCWTGHIKDVKLRDHFTNERFLQVIPHAAMMWVRERRPTTGREAADWTTTYFEDRPHGEFQPRKSNDFRQGSYRPNSNSKRQYSRQEGDQGEQTTKEEGHKPSDRVTWDKERGPRCFTCQKFGHMAPSCPEAKSAPKREQTGTQEGKLGELHQNGKLPVSEGSINGSKATRLLTAPSPTSTQGCWTRTTRMKVMSRSAAFSGRP